MNKHERQAAEAAKLAQEQARFVVNGIERFHPTGWLVLLEATNEKFSSGRILMPDSAKPTLPVGRIVAMGHLVPAQNTEHCDGFKVGELVSFSESTAVQLDSKHYMTSAKLITCHVDEPSRLIDPTQDPAAA